MAKKKTNLDGLRRKAKNFVNGLVQPKTKIAAEVVEGMLSTVARGQSPVRDVGRYESYKDPKKYPAKMKKRSPVTLYLTGKLLRALTYRIVKNQMQIGIFNQEQAKKMAGLEAGTVAKPPRPRRTIPRRSGEEFTVKIMRDLMRSLKELFKKTK